MLIQRVITAIILIPLVLAILFFAPPVIFFGLTSLVVLMAGWEWSRLMNLKATSHRVLYLLFMLLIMGWILFVPMRWIYLAAFGWWVVALVLVWCYPNLSSTWAKNRLIQMMMGLLVLIPCWVGINTIRNQQDGVWGILFLFALIWGADSAAYFTGRKWGKAKLLPLVSPGKTWMGLFGALAATILIAMITLYLSQAPKSLWPWAILLSLITVLFSILGDLFESMLKREAGVKDSGNLLPGHGGILDRIDSLTAAVPIFVIGGLLLGSYFGSKV